MDTGRKLVAKTSLSKINPAAGNSISGQTINKDQVVKYSSKTYTLNNNKLCLRTESNTRTGEMMCMLYEQLQEGPAFTNLDSVTKLITNKTVSKIDPIDNTPLPGQVIEKGQVVEYTSKAITRLNNEVCLRTKANTNSGTTACIPSSALSELPSFTALPNPRLLVAKETVQKIDPYTGTMIANQTVPRGMLVEFSSQINMIKTSELCLRTTSNTQTNLSICLPANRFKEYINPNFTGMEVSRDLKTKGPTIKIDPVTGEEVEKLPADIQVTFSQKTYRNSSLCLRTKTDMSLNKQACVLYSSLIEL